MIARERLRYDADGVFDLDPGLIDAPLRQAVLQCIELQKRAVQGGTWTPHAGALEEVSEQALRRVLESSQDVHGLASDTSLSNVIAFSAPNLSGAVRDEAVEAARGEVDRRIADLVRGLFRRSGGLEVVSSGHLWYPPGSYMGWHTNSRVPGWRVYVNVAEGERGSFFRYRDPADGRIVTLDDARWNIRAFRITAARPLWHAVYSNTNRFSMGYMVYRVGFWRRVVRKMKHLARVG